MHDPIFIDFCLFSRLEQGGISVNVGPVEPGLAKTLVPLLALAVSEVTLWSMGAAVVAS